MTEHLEHRTIVAVDAGADDARRVLTRAARPRLFEARGMCGLCGLCGRALTEGEPVWIDRLAADGEGGAARWVPLGAECVAPAFREAMAGREPAPCAGCGRGVYARYVHPRRRRVTCSRRCAQRATRVRTRAARRRGSE